MTRIIPGILFLVTVLCFSCKKVAGTGGKTIINVHLVDSNMNVPNAEIKIKYNASSYPGASAIYDNSIMADQYGKNSFIDLKQGDYYIYSSYTDANGNFNEGGAYVKATNKPREQYVVIDFDKKEPF